MLNLVLTKHDMESMLDDAERLGRVIDVEFHSWFLLITLEDGSQLLYEKNYNLVRKVETELRWGSGLPLTN